MSISYNYIQWLEPFQRFQNKFKDLEKNEEAKARK